MLEVKTPDEVLQVIDAEFSPLADCVEAVPLVQAIGRVLAEDVVTTGKSSMETAKVIEELGGEVIGIACIVDRRVNDIFCPVYSAMQLEIATYEADECPLCKAGIPLVKPGSRKFDK